MGSLPWFSSCVRLWEQLVYFSKPSRKFAVWELPLKSKPWAWKQKGKVSGSIYRLVGLGYLRMEAVPAGGEGRGGSGGAFKALRAFPPLLSPTALDPQRGPTSHTRGALLLFLAPPYSPGYLP